MKKLSLMLALSWMVLYVWSAPRTQSQILEIASSHLSRSLPTAKSALTLEQAIGASQFLTQAKSTADIGEPFYVFTVDTTAFVIVSTEDRMAPILGYSTQSGFNTTQMADNTRGWLQSYYDAYIQLQNQSDTQGSFYYAPVASDLPTTIAPLLGDIAWDQGAPYNANSPLYNGEHTATGCVATAMAQIMMYHRYPDAGVGSHSYTTEALGLSLSADFSQPINWHYMTPTYDQYSTAESKQAVAKLMYQCGVSVDMDYHISSGARCANVPQALVGYFKYSPDYRSYQRDYHSSDQWMSLIKRELSDLRPILYRGQSSGGGHAFVLDGYDSKGLVHINWGWSGSNNGYFVVSSLNPSTPGIGGGTGGYNTNQGMWLGLQRPSSDTRYESYFLASEPVTISANSVARNDVFTLGTTRVYNQGSDFTGKIQAVLYRDGQPVVAFGRVHSASVRSGYGWSRGLEFANLSIPPTIQPGDYQLYIASRDDRESQWSIVRSKVHQIGYYNVHVEADRVTFSSAIDKVDMECTSIAVSHRLYSTMAGDFECDITNLGTECVANIALFIQPEAGGDFSILSQETVYLTIGAQAQLQYSPTINLPAGDYNIKLAYSLADELWQPMMPGSKRVTVYAAPTGSPSLKINSPIEVERTTIAVGESLRVSASISNSGAPFSDPISYSFYDRSTTPMSYVGRIRSNKFVDTDQSIVWRVDQSPALKPGVYEMQLRYMDDDSYMRMAPYDYGKATLTVISGSGIADNLPQGGDCYYLASDSRLYITRPESADRLDIVNLSGAVVLSTDLSQIAGASSSISVETLPAALYMVRLYSANRVYSTKFVKQ